MRLLYVIDSLAPGGAETSLAEMAPGLVAAGIDLHILPLGRARDLEQRLEEAGAVVHRRSGRPGRVGSVRAIMDLSRQIDPALIHTTLYEADVAGRTAARLIGKPSSTSLVNDSYDASHRAEAPRLKLAAAQAVDAFTARWATKFHANSRAIAEGVGPRLGIRKNLIEVIPRGRDPKRHPFRSRGVRARVRAELGIDGAAPVLLAVGRQEPQKGLHNFLDSASRVAVDHPGMVAVIAGRDGRASAELRSIAQGLGLEVRFLGHRTDVPYLLCAADVLCFPSEREGLPGTLIEAMAVGCPIVASDIAPTREVVGDDGLIAALSPVGDVAALARDVTEMLANPAATDVRTQRGRATFEERFTIDSVTRRMAQFFAEASRIE